MQNIYGIGAIILGLWQLFMSKQYFDNIRKQSSPLLFALIALIASMIFGAFLIIWGTTRLIWYVNRVKWYVHKFLCTNAR